MKFQYYFYLILTVLVFQGCEDFLDEQPQDFLSEESYFNKPSDLEAFENKFYTSFDVNTENGQSSVYAKDRNSDDEIGPAPDDNLLFDYKMVPASPRNDKRSWRFDNIRETNYFFEKVNERIENGDLDFENSDVKHFIGENHFFRAWFYFNKLQAFGDFPIIKTVLSDNNDTLVNASKRHPRNEVARFILDDLDQAIELLNNSKSKNRVMKDAALLLASRVALFEGTWLKYHTNTSRVPGGPDWPGNEVSPNYSFPSGNINSESDYFLRKAIEYSDEIASKLPLYNDYEHMFKAHDLENIDEVILYKSYGVENVPGHATTHYLQRTGGGIGYSRSLIESFLMKSGLPIYAQNSDYKGDQKLSDVVKDRDERLVTSVFAEGDIVKREANGAVEIFEGPEFFNGSGWQSVTTGYQLKKWVSTDPKQAESINAGTTQVPIFRAAEAYINYIEAYYELNGSLDGNAKSYWELLRVRAGVDPDYQKTIANTTLSKERDLAKYSGDHLIDATLYNIRRERRNEFLAEGRRLMDLYRWRALDKMQNYIVEGYNFWDFYASQFKDTVEEGENISFPEKNGGSKYVQPFRIKTTNKAFNGYSFPQAHYLEPIPLDQFNLTNSVNEGGILYQNPGWSKTSSSSAEF